MAGRHSLNARSATFFTRGRTGFITATAAGTIVGIGLPAANASPQEVSLQATANAVRVEIGASQDAPVNLPVVELKASSGAQWELATIEFEAEEPVVEVAPAVEEVAVVEAEQSATVQQTPAQSQVAQPRTTQAQEAPAQAQAAPVAQAPQAQPAPAVNYGGNSAAVAIARQYSGVPYRSGGTTPAGWDCSGFTSYVYAQVGVSLPRTSGGQLGAGRRVSAAEARPGDLVWWPGHVGIYTGNGQHIAARNPRAGTHEGPVYGSPVYVRIGG